jgi:hypothetical protein
VNENTVFFAIALPNTNILNLCQLTNKLVISKQMWKTIQNKFQENEETENIIVFAHVSKLENKP